ncbi:PREDICTED: uncharacterized protein LOC108634809, partial [Capra hircus]
VRSGVSPPRIPADCHWLSTASSWDHVSPGLFCGGPADRTGRGKDGASRTEHGSPVVETGVCPTGRGFGSRCDVRKPWPLKRAHAGAAAVQREISSGSSCPSSEQRVPSGPLLLPCTRTLPNGPRNSLPQRSVLATTHLHGDGDGSVRPRQSPSSRVPGPCALAFTPGTVRSVGLCRTCPEPCGIVPDQGFGGKHPVPLPPRQVDPSPLDHQAGKSLHSLLKASTLKQSTSSSKHHWTITTERKETMTLQEAARVPVCEKRRSTLHDAIPFPGLIVQKLSHPKRGTAGYPSRVWDGGFPGGSVGNRPVPTQETRVSSPARDDPTCYRATKPIGLADGIRALDPGHCER